MELCVALTRAGQLAVLLAKRREGLETGQVEGGGSGSQVKSNYLWEPLPGLPGMLQRQKD